MPENYDLLLERIANSSKLDKSEIEKRIEARRAKLSGLISKEGAAQIIAAELGVNFDNVRLKVSELMPGMKKVNTLVKVVNVFPVRSFEKGNRKGKVSNLIVGDETGSLRLVLWDTNHIDLIEKNEVKKGDVIEVKNGSVREGEIHLSGFSEIKKSNDNIQNVKVEKVFSEKSVDSLQEGNNVSLRGLIVQIFPPRFFLVCPECGKKLTSEGENYSCAEHGKVLPKEKALLNFVLDDGTEALRTVIFSDQLEKMIELEKLKDNVSLSIFRDDLLGTEFFVKGNVRKNSLFNVLEMSVQEINKVNVDELVLNLEK